MPNKTKEFLKRIWDDSVWSKVIARVILWGFSAAFIVLLILFRKTILPFLGTSFNIKVWLFIILCLPSIRLLFIIARDIKNKKLLSSDKISEFEEFEENIDNLIWKGSYSKLNGKLCQFSAHCPECDLELSPPRNVFTNNGFLTGKEYICEHCNKRLFNFIEGRDHKSFVKREIEKRLRIKSKS
jgi:hypothetical protein